MTESSTAAHGGTAVATGSRSSPRAYRVLLTVDSLAAGGTERVTVDVANVLHRRGHHVWLCTTRAGGPLAESLDPGVRVASLRRRSRWDVGQMVAFSRLVQRERFDVIHSMGRGATRLVSLCRAARAFRTAHVFHDHAGTVHAGSGTSRSLRAAVRLGVDWYLGVDEALCAWARRRLPLPRHRVTLVRNGLDLDRFAAVDALDVRRELGLRIDSTVLAMVANLRTEKDHQLILRALARCPARERLTLLLVGSMPDPALERNSRELARTLGIEHLVRFLGQREDVPAVLAGSDVGVLSSRSETGPLAVLEYLASGLPVLATRTGEVVKGLQGERVGRFVPTQDLDAMTDGLRWAASLTPEAREEMGARGRRLVRDAFSLDASLDQVLAVYDQLAGSKIR